MAKKYKIERNLVLNEIKEGGAGDRVIVIDENNEVGSVARSEFGGGGNQDLQSVLDNGNLSDTEIRLLNGAGIYFYSELDDEEYKLGFNVESNQGQINLFNNNLLNSIRPNPLQTEVGRFYLPKGNTIYQTLATLDDIPAGLTTNVPIDGGRSLVFVNGILNGIDDI